MIDDDLRRTGICASDVGAIFQVDPWRDPLAVWAHKKGLPSTPPKDFMIVGHELERGVAALYAYKTGRTVTWVDRTFRHPARPWMVYTPDALVEGERRGVDAKVILGFDQRKYWGPTADQIPPRVQLQCWWYMAAMDYDVWDVAAFMGDGLPVVYEVPRDREAERVMLDRVYEWYRRYIVGNERPPMTDSRRAAAWLQHVYPRHREPLREATTAEAAMLDEYVEVRMAEANLKRLRANCEHAIKDAIKDAAGLQWSGGKITWRRSKDGEVINWQAIARGLLPQFDKETQTTLLGLHTTPKAGSRSLRLTALAMKEQAEEDTDE